MSGRKFLRKDEKLVARRLREFAKKIRVGDVKVLSFQIDTKVERIDRGVMGSRRRPTGEETIIFTIKKEL